MKQITINVSNRLQVSNLPRQVVEELFSIFIIDNPKFKENNKHGHSNLGVPSRLTFIQDTRTLILPKGAINTLKKKLKEYKLDFKVVDYTLSSPFDIKSNIKLHDYQKKACERMLKRRFGVLQAPTGSGKTVMAIKLIEERKEKTLIVVHTKELMYQWRERLLEFTDMKEIGLQGDGNKTIEGVTIGIINTLQKSVYNYKDFFGHVIVDECHRCPSTTFSKFLKRMNTKYMLGLSATPYRRDELSQVINFFMGDTIHEIETKKLQKQGHIMKAKLKVIQTKFNTYVKSVYDYQKVIKKMVNNDKRNNLIVNKVIKQAEKEKGKGVILVISDRKNHCEDLFMLLSDSLFRTFLVTGSTPKDKRQYAIEQLNAGKGEILIATGQLIGEGFDLKHLSSIFLTTPIKYQGRLIQYIGRILRKAEGKEKATIYDFEDPCWLLKGSFGKRMKTYKEMGIVK
jgi:superfamily II DNA or RNA helicase